MDMEDAIVNNIIGLYKERKWRDIVEMYHDHPERHKILWVFPSEENFQFIASCLNELHCDAVLSVGCGSGLLEWMLTEATGAPVTGVEVDGAWWRCKYAPPTFISLLLTSPTIDKDMISTLHKCQSTALLFCYFNNRPAFDDYLSHYPGSVLIIIGPDDGKGVHTDPKPFGDVTQDWKLYKYQEVRRSKDFIAIYYKTTLFSIPVINNII